MICPWLSERDDKLGMCLCREADDADLGGGEGDRAWYTGRTDEMARGRLATKGRLECWLRSELGVGKLCEEAEDDPLSAAETLGDAAVGWYSPRPVEGGSSRCCRRDEGAAEGGAAAAPMG